MYSFVVNQNFQIIAEIYQLENITLHDKDKYTDN